MPPAAANSRSAPALPQAAHEFLRHGAQAVALDQIVHRLIRKDNYVETLPQAARLDIGVFTLE